MREKRRETSGITSIDGRTRTKGGRRQDQMTKAERYPLARVGKGSKTHVLDPNQQVRCKNEGSGSWYRRQDADGRYQDPSLESPITPLEQTGLPTCYWCLTALDR
jgi:hypothetical protein